MRVGIVNDLALAREVLRRVVHSVPQGSVAWFAEDGEQAVRLALADPPDVILMDLVMPRLDGAEATRRIMKQAPCPILIVTSTLTGHFDLVYQAMGAGGLDAVETPSLAPDGTLLNANPIVDRLLKLQRSFSEPSPSFSGSGPLLSPPCQKPLTRSRGMPWMKPASDAAQFPLVAIGASTGGPTALMTVLGHLPADLPAGIIIVQHIAAEFAAGLAAWLSSRCRLQIRSAEEGDRPRAGCALVAVSNDHLELGEDGRLNYTPWPKDRPYRPSIDVLFHSLAKNWPVPGVAVVLTGMGDDGADGLFALREKGWHTIAQDEQTSVVYGMPKAAVERNAVVEVLPLEAIGSAIVAQINASKSH